MALEDAPLTCQVITKDLKRSTRQGYQSIIDNHLIPELGALKLGAIDARQLERYLAARVRALRPLGADPVPGDDERVFCHPRTGGVLDDRRYAKTLRLALAGAKITDYVRPLHDGRHTSLTNAAAAGMSPAALMARTGHSDFKTTQGYIDLAGETFREEEELLEARLFGQTLGQK